MKILKNATAAIVIAAVAVLSASAAAHAEVISGYNGITIDTADAGVSFASYTDPNDDYGHISSERVFTDDSLSASLLAAYESGPVYWAFSWYGRDKVLLRADWGAWQWTVSERPVDGAPDRCATFTDRRKKYRVKTIKLQCTPATQAIKTYVATGKTPAGYKCATTFKSKSCQKISIANDDVSAFPVIAPEESAMQAAWDNRLILCGVSDTYKNLNVYAEHGETCDKLDGKLVNKMSADNYIASQIVGRSPYPDEEAAFIPSPIGGVCKGSNVSLYCGEGEDCIALVNPLFEGNFAGIDVATWKYGRFAYRTTDYDGC